jgi:hypothetical protein
MTAEQHALIARMLGGEPFTRAALRSLAKSHSERLAVTITILRLWCSGKIAWARENGRVVWRAVQEGRQ